MNVRSPTSLSCKYMNKQIHAFFTIKEGTVKARGFKIYYNCSVVFVTPSPSVSPNVAEDM